MSNETKVIFPNRNYADVATELTVAYMKNFKTLTPDEVAAAYEKFYLKAVDMQKNALVLVPSRRE